MESTLPNIKLLNGSQVFAKHQLLYDKFKKHYENNPFESVFDLEEKYIKINRFARVFQNSIYYLEVDSRNDLSEEQVNQILYSLRLNKTDENIFNHFARMIVVGYGQTTTEMTRGGSDYSNFCFRQGFLSFTEQKNKFKVLQTNGDNLEVILGKPSEKRPFKSRSSANGNIFEHSTQGLKPAMHTSGSDGLITF